MRLCFITQVVDDEDAVLGFLPTWLRELAGRVEYLDVVTFQAGVKPELPANVHVASLGRERGVKGARLLLNFRKEVRRAVNAAKCDRVLVHMVPKYAVLARRLAVPRRVPIYLWYTHAGINPWLRWSEPLVVKIFTASEESLRLPTSKKVVTRHGIDTDFLRPDPASAPAPGKLVTVGRLTPSKDAGFLMEGCAALRGQGLDVSLDLVGDGLVASDADYKLDMAELAKKLDISDRVRFEGAVPYKRIPPVYRRGRVFVSASRTGSVDKAVLEAMACGVPVLTSNDAFRAILPPAFRFEPRNLPEFAAKAREILSWDLTRWRREGQALREIVVRDHAVGPLAERLVQEMSSIPAGGGARP